MTSPPGPLSSRRRGKGDWWIKEQRLKNLSPLIQQPADRG